MSQSLQHSPNSHPKSGLTATWSAPQTTAASNSSHPSSTLSQPGPNNQKQGRPAKSQNEESYASEEDSPDRSGDPNASKKRKRNRVILSCTNCKARKIKCNRMIPGCESCIRRGLSHTCRWGDERDNAFLGAERSNEMLMNRIRDLESMVASLKGQDESGKRSTSQRSAAAGGSRSISPRVNEVSRSKYDRGEPSWSASQSTAETKKRHRNPSSSGNSERNSDSRIDEGATGGEYQKFSDEESEEESDTEDAAQILEAMADGIPSFIADRKATLPSFRPNKNDLEGSDGERTASSRKADYFNSNHHSHSSRPQNGSRRNNEKFSLPPLPGLSNLSVVPALPSMNANYQDSQIEQCLRLLPKMNDLKLIVSFYLEEIEPIVNCLNSVIFKQQLSEFESAINAKVASSPLSSPISIDLTFLGLLFAILSAAAEYRTSTELVTYGFAPNEESMDLILESFYCSSITLLGLSDFGERPTMNGLSSVIALSHYAFARRKQQSYGALVVMSLRLAEVLGLHRLGSALDDAERWKKERDSSSDEVQLPNGGTKQRKIRRLSSASTHSHSSGSLGQSSSGSASSKSLGAQGKEREKQPLHGMFLPPGLVQLRESETQYADYSHSKRETARMIWTALCTLESFTSAHVGTSTYLASSNGITTAYPQNLEDEEIPDSESGDYSINPHPFEVPTTKRFIPILHEIGTVARRIVDSMIAGEGYSAISSIDSSMMKIKTNLPKFFVFDGRTEHTEEMKRLHRKHPYLTFQRILLNEWIFHRLLQCHRIYMTRGHKNPKYKHSLDRSIECAVGIIQMRREMDAYMRAAPGRQARANYGLLTVHLFQAASALQMFLLQQVSALEPISDHLQKDIDDSIIYLEAHPSGQTRQAMAQNAIDVLRKLRSEMKARLDSRQQAARVDSRQQAARVDSQQQANAYQPTANYQNAGSSTSSLQAKGQAQAQGHVHFQSQPNAKADVSRRSWTSYSNDEMSLPSSSNNNLPPRLHSDGRAATWQSPKSYPPQDQSSGLQTHVSNPLPSLPVSQDFAPDSNSSETAELPFDLDAYLKSVSVIVPGDRGDRVFQTLDGLLNAESGASLDTSQVGRNPSSTTSSNAFGIGSVQNIPSFPIPPQVTAPLPISYGPGITTASASTLDSASFHPPGGSNSNHNSPFIQSSASSPVDLLDSHNHQTPTWQAPKAAHQSSPPSNYSSASNSPHSHQNNHHWPNQQIHYQAQQR